jgi:hypothetical protein
LSKQKKKKKTMMIMMMNRCFVMFSMGFHWRWQSFTNPGIQGCA